MPERFTFHYPPGNSIGEEEWAPFVHPTMPTRNGDVNVNALWSRFRESEYGIHMETQPFRFSQDFGYDREQMLQDLGPDVDPNEHQVSAGAYISWVLMAEQQQRAILPIDPTYVGLLRFTGLIHDIGESTHPKLEKAVGAVVGDIPRGKKTPEQRTIENLVRAELYARLFDDVDQRMLRIVDDIIRHEDDSPLHDIYDLGHDLLTYDTGRRAGESAARRSQDEDPASVELAAKLQRMSDSVSAHMVPRIAHRAGQYALAADYIATMG